MVGGGMAHRRENDGSPLADARGQGPSPPGSAVVNATRIIVIALALTAFAVMTWRISDALLIAFGGIVLGAGLLALAMPVRRWTGWSERSSLAAVVVALGLLVGLTGWLFGRGIAQQATEMEEMLPKQMHRVADWARRWEVGHMLVDSLRKSAGDAKTVAQLGLFAGAILNAGFDFIFIVFLGICLARHIDGPVEKSATRALCRHHLPGRAAVGE